MLKNISFSLLVLLVFIFFGGCANQGYPEGGPRDEDPPRMVASSPPLNATNFDGDEIEIEFNELIVLKETMEKVVISPPLNEQPIIQGLGNKVTIIFEEELQPATTYTIDFGDAIRDNNEGNALDGYTFSFSTGETQDSLQISGNLYEADTHTPVEGALVMAHSNHADSAFTNMVPVRVAKTNETGRFVIRNLAEGEYRVFALEDLNRDYRFDQPGERIAWHSELIEPDYEYRERIDSVFTDSADQDTDSATLDTVLVTEELVYTPDSLKLFLFQEDYKEQYLDVRERKERHRLDFVFNRPLEKSLKINLLEPTPGKNDWYIYERSAKHDSVMIWLTDSALISSDSLQVEVTFPVLDSLDNYVDRTDTLQMLHRTRKSRGADTQEEEETKPDPLSVRAPVGAFEIRGTPRLEFPVPLATIDREALELSQLEDTVYFPVEFELEQDSVRIRNYKILHSWEPGAEYEFTIDSAAISDIFGRVNNPVRNTFDIKTEDSYGTLYVEASNFPENALLQVLNREEKVIRKGDVPQNGKLGFRHLKPGKYFIRIVEDENDNKKWDTGDFREGIQPEKVFYYPETIQVRANWDQMVPWDLDEYSISDFVNNNRIEEDNNNSRNQ